MRLREAERAIYMEILTDRVVPTAPVNPEQPTHKRWLIRTSQHRWPPKITELCTVLTDLAEEAFERCSTAPVGPELLNINRDQGGSSASH